MHRIKLIHNFLVTASLFFHMKLLLIMKMISYSNANKTYFHKKSFALSLVLKVRFWNSEMAYSYKLLYGASSIPNLSKAHSGSLQSRC